LIPRAELASLLAPMAMTLPSRLTEIELPNSSNASVFEPFK
jgi:hypothetical protein